MLSKLSMAACSGCLLLAGAAPAQAESVEGRLDWAGERGLGLAVAGIVESVAARTGAVVAAGEELLRLDPRPFVARRDLAEAGLQGIAPGAAEAEAEFERAQDLLDRTVISEADFRLAEIAVAQARARLRGAEAELTLADWQLAHSRLVADRPLRVLAVRAVAAGSKRRSWLSARLGTAFPRGCATHPAGPWLDWNSARPKG